MDILQDIWIYKNNEWILAKLKKKIENKYEIIVKNESLIIDHIEIKNKDEEDSVNDFINIPHLNEPSILNGLNLRYISNNIYTYTGKILISVNPFKNLGLYTKKNMDYYKNTENNNPHLYQITKEAYNNMINFNNNQSILVSGESGAGKTHATKMMLEYITYISGKDKEIEQKILLSNPILEAFGNAKTIRNDNSSRFGKFIKLGFNNYKLIGATINTYLLEKIRLIYQGNNERNFHIFYLIMKGMDKDMKSKYFIEETEYNYLKNGYIKRSDDVNDLEEFNITLDAFKKLDFSNNDIDLIFKITCGILNLGNIKFDQDGHILNKQQVDIVSKLLNVPHDLLLFTLLNRNLIVSGEKFEIKLKKKECVYTRDSISMKLYQYLFDFILVKINNSLKNNIKNELFIGILDIFGFESIEYNSFEQLCINYTNEKLQNQFNKYIFELEQEEYKKEQINWDTIKFPDNSECLKLIDGKFGILSMLDEECKLPKGNDINFTSKITKKYKDNIYFIKNKKFNNEKISINHYAGEVIYNTNNFCEKNKDIVSNEINILLKKIEICNINDEKNISILKSKSLSFQFKNQLKELINIINKTTTHYIRCIKPNDLNESDNFNKKKIVHQLKYCGVLEAIKVARSGYAIKMKFNYFMKRYKMIENCKSIKLFSENNYLNKNDYQIGLTKVFLKTDSYEFLENLRLNKLNINATNIQKIIRKFIIRKNYLIKYISIITIQGFCRIIIAKNKLNLLKKIKSQIIISKYFRKYLCYKSYNSKRNNIIYIQNYYRKYKINYLTFYCKIIQKLFKKYLNKKVSLEEIKIKNIIKIQKYIRKFIYKNKFKKSLRTIIRLQRNFRKKKNSKNLIIKQNKKLNKEILKKDNILKENEFRIKNLEERQEEMLKIIKKLENIQKEEEENNIKIESLNNDIIQYKDCIVNTINSKADMFEELEKIKIENYLLKKN